MNSLYLPSSKKIKFSTLRNNSSLPLLKLIDENISRILLLMSSELVESNNSCALFHFQLSYLTFFLS